MTKIFQHPLQTDTQSIPENVVPPPIEKIPNNAWSVDFCKQVLGGWKGRPLRRFPQGTFEVRDELE